MTSLIWLYFINICPCSFLSFCSNFSKFLSIINSVIPIFSSFNLILLFYFRFLYSLSSFFQRLLTVINIWLRNGSKEKREEWRETFFARHLEQIKRVGREADLQHVWTPFIHSFIGSSSFSNWQEIGPNHWRLSRSVSETLLSSSCFLLHFLFPFFLIRFR